MPQLPGHRSTLPDLAGQKRAQLDGFFRQSIPARDNRTNGARVIFRDCRAYLSSFNAFRNTAARCELGRDDGERRFYAATGRRRAGRYSSMIGKPI
jgi:hypothetical protein